MMTISSRMSRAAPIRLVRATCRVPFGLMPLTAAMAVMRTAGPSHANQLMQTTAYNVDLLFRKGAWLFGAGQKSQARAAERFNLGSFSRSPFGLSEDQYRHIALARAIQFDKEHALPAPQEKTATRHVQAG